MLVKRPVPEAGAQWCRRRAAPAAGHVIMTVRVIDMFRALNRRLRAGPLDSWTYAAVAADIESVCAAE